MSTEPICIEWVVVFSCPKLNCLPTPPPHPHTRTAFNFQDLWYEILFYYVDFFRRIYLHIGLPSGMLWYHLYMRLLNIPLYIPNVVLNNTSNTLLYATTRRDIFMLLRSLDNKGWLQCWYATSKRTSRTYITVSPICFAQSEIWKIESLFHEDSQYIGVWKCCGVWIMFLIIKMSVYIVFNLCAKVTQCWIFF